MAVTDLSGDLPWWVRQATPSPPTAAPGQSGMGWLNYLSQMFAPNPANTPSADAQNMSMLNSGVGATSEGFPIPGSLNPNSIEARARAIQNPPPPAPQTAPALPVDAAPPPAPAPGPSLTMGPSGPPVGAALPDISGVPRIGGVLATQPSIPGASAPSGAGLPDLTGIPRNAAGVLATNPPAGATPAPAPAASPAATPAPAGPLSASGGATGQGATSNPRFTGVPFSYDVPGTARAGRGAPIYTAMDLSGLFNRGQPAAARAANVPTRNAQPVSAPAGPLATRNISKAPWSMGPFQQKSPFGPFMPSSGVDPSLYR